MKKFHANRYGEIVKCKTLLHVCTNHGTHFTEEEAALIKKGNSEDSNLTNQQTEFYLNHINHKHSKQKLDSQTKRQFGAVPEDYTYDHRRSIKRIDPFKLNVIVGTDLNKQLAKDDNINLGNLNSMKENAYMSTIDFGKIWDVYLGQYKPKKAASVELAYHYFNAKHKIVIPAGTLVRTTKPSEKETCIVTRNDKTVYVLNVNSGSLGFKDEFITFASVTWLGLDGWLYNVPVTQTVLEAN